VLRGLRRFLGGAPVTLVWDNLPAHHSRLMGAWLEGQRHWLQVEYLPGYATTWTRWRDCGPTSRTWSWPT
jgi:transposase